MTTSPPEPNGDEFPDVPDFIDEDEFLTAAPKEGTADERAAQAARIAQGNDRLRQAGEISDGSGKPVYRRSGKVTVRFVATHSARPREGLVALT